MIDWPRRVVMRHLTDGGNVALVARRQFPPSQPCNYFFIADAVALDGLIRSDNRGSESIFPLYLKPAESTRRDQADSGRAAEQAQQANFSPAFIEDCERQLELRWNPTRKDDGPETFGPDDLLHYIYALFHSSSYRKRFSAWLRLDFPRIFIPKNVKLFRQLSAGGAELVAAHLLRLGKQDAGCDNRVVGGTVDSGYPKYMAETIWINPHQGFSHVTKGVWQSRIGTYQVCRKWLKDRQGRELSCPDVERYREMVRAIEHALAVMQRIDRHIECGGGWDKAF